MLPSIDLKWLAVAVLSAIALGAMFYAARAPDPPGETPGLIVLGLCFAGIAWLCKQIADALEREVWSRNAARRWRAASGYAGSDVTAASRHPTGVKARP